MTVKQANEILTKAGKEPLEEIKENKYRNNKVEIDGITFDSEKEANYYCELKIRKRAVEIKSFRLQPRYLLQEKYVDKQTGKKVRAIYYKADFEVIHNDGSIEVIEVKGMKTQVYKLKIKMFRFRYPDLKLTVI